MRIIACGSWILGAVGIILAVVCKLGVHEIVGVSARSFAAGAALLLLLSVAAHQCVACHKES